MTQTESTVLVTGGAGYIGSHAVKMLVERGRRVVVVDNLEYGHVEALPDGGVTFIEGDVGDATLMDAVFTEHSIAAVLHFAAYIFVGESVRDPAKYYANNTAAPLTLLAAMRRHGCNKLIFSSTAATYGDPEYVPIDEQHPQRPINPYGASKFMLETILRDHENAYGFRNVFLRYFNVAGADESGLIGEDHHPETHLIPLILSAALKQRDAITVFGNDYDTPDGTCIRDYIHVVDLVRAHILALEHLESGGESLAVNLGVGHGFSVMEMIDAARDVTGVDIPITMGSRREGDPPQLVADPSRAREKLGWHAEYTDVHDIIRTAWNWMTGPRKGHY